MGPKVRRAGHDASQQIELRAQRVSAWWLATARGALGWTLEQMAIYFRCSRSTCVNYECFDGVRGTPLPDYRRRMLTMLLAKRGLLAEVDRRVEAREQALSVGRIG